MSIISNSIRVDAVVSSYRSISNIKLISLYNSYYSVSTYYYDNELRSKRSIFSVYRCSHIL